jgi:hypothetical protein
MTASSCKQNKVLGIGPWKYARFIVWDHAYHLEISPLLRVQGPVLESLESLGDICFRVDAEIA